MIKILLFTAVVGAAVVFAVRTAAYKRVYASTKDYLIKKVAEYV